MLYKFGKPLKGSHLSGIRPWTPLPTPIENWETPNALEQRKDTVSARHQEVTRDHNKPRREEEEPRSGETCQKAFLIGQERDNK